MGGREGFASFLARIASDPGRRTVPTGESSPSRPFPALLGFPGTMGSRSQDPNGHNGPGPTILDCSRESTKAACVLIWVHLWSVKCIRSSRLVRFSETR
jgi:hypothetical protein